MKKNFTIKSIAKNVQLSSTKQEGNSILRLLAEDVCCSWAVAIVGNATAQKSLVLR